MTSIRRAHSPEVVAYPQWGEWLVRCHGCGARIWCQSEEEAAEVFAGHGRAGHEQVVPQRVHAVVGKNDKGTQTELRQFATAPEALAFIEHAADDGHHWGWSFAYLTGYRSPKWLISQLALPSTNRAFDSVERPALPSGE